MRAYRQLQTSSAPDGDLGLLPACLSVRRQGPLCADPASISHTYVIEFCSTANKKGPKTSCPCKQKPRGHYAKAPRSKGLKKHQRDVCFYYMSVHAQLCGDTLEPSRV
ncbi:hypothetical protein EYF80_041269 [Liparis tanakae]|uniref:Uncharacterized protein n=1 Tax=Liparis tanakae TaxID=230148 RepID=A0A4Z2G618_9TELE|nr:hypothetical protein EYF80_041269 [Liparis tanakae]